MANSYVRTANNGVAVRCSNGGYEDETHSALGVYPPPHVVESVVARDPCPRCGRMTMAPVAQ